MIVYLNGDFAPAGARIKTKDRGFLLGDGAFETIYVEDGRAAFLGAHLARLAHGLATLKIDPPPRLADAAAIISELAQRNGLAGKRASARLTVSRGIGPRGLVIPAEASPTMLVAVTAAAPPLRAPSMLHIAARRRFTQASTLSFKPIGGYIENILALSDAIEAGADDAVMLNEFGRAASATSANLFIIDANGAVATPPAAEGAMPGVVRGLVVDGATSHGVRIEERPIAAEEITASFVFLTNSLRGLAEARPLGADLGDQTAARAIFQTLRTWYQERLRDEIAAEARAR